MKRQQLLKSHPVHTLFLFECPVALELQGKVWRKLAKAVKINRQKYLAGVRSGSLV